MIAPRVETLKSATLEWPLVTAVVPCRNEARFIRRCLTTILDNQLQPGRFELIVVDGMSDDGTRAIVGEFAAQHSNVTMLDNPSGIIPAAMNIGIAAARGSVILKIDAHSSYPPDYVARTVARLVESGVDCVGGVLRTEAAVPTAVAESIAYVLAHPFGSGNSRFRTGTAEPVLADTAAFGCYPRSVFDRVGLYDERLVRSSDMDLNTRIRLSGGSILLDPAISATYYPRSTAWGFFVRNFVDGFWALYPRRFGSSLARVRHHAPATALVVVLLLAGLSVVDAAFLAVLGGIVAVYTVAAATTGIRAAVSSRRPSFAVLVPLMFAMRHGAYAAGSLVGLLRAAMFPEFWVRPRSARVAS